MFRDGDYMKKSIRYDRILLVIFMIILLMFSAYKLIVVNKPVIMIDLSTKTVDEIKAYAKDKKLKLEIKEEANDDVEKGSVIIQSIKQGESLTEGQRLIVHVSMGKINYEDYNVDESGSIPVLMYHGIHSVEETKYIGGNVDKDGYQRTSDAFKRDLEFFYKNDYRMIRLKDYVDGVIDVSLGKSPIVLTFDDGLENNIKVLGLDDKGEIIIDPESAVGIMEGFKKKYSDFNVTATFFVNGGLFHQPLYNDKILKWLVNNGYDVGNHSYGHSYLEDVEESYIQYDIARLYKKLDEIIPNQYVNIVAMPFGQPRKKTHVNFPYVLKGEHEGYKYESTSALRVGWMAELSPFHKNFDKTYIMRIRAYDNLGKEFDIEHNFNILSGTRYISDGNKEKIVVPENRQDKIKSSLQVITY